MRRVICWLRGHKWHQHTWDELMWDERTLRTRRIEISVLLCDRCHLFWEDQ